MSIKVRSSNTAVVSWIASYSVCDGGLVGNYSVSYKLANESGNYLKVYTSNTSVILEGLVLNAGYDVSVTAINSKGGMRTSSRPFTVTTSPPPTAPTQRSTEGKANCICRGYFWASYILCLWCLSDLSLAKVTIVLMHTCTTIVTAQAEIIADTKMQEKGLYVSTIVYAQAETMIDAY